MLLLNYQVKSNQTDFFESISALMKPGATLVVGHNYMDSNYIESPFSIQEYMQRHFSQLQFVSLGKPKLKHEKVLRKLFSTVAKGMAKHFPNNTLQQILDSLEEYLRNYTQFLYTATLQNPSNKGWYSSYQEPMYTVVKQKDSVVTSKQVQTEKKIGADTKSVESKKEAEFQTTKIDNGFLKTMMELLLNDNSHCSGLTFVYARDRWRWNIRTMARFRELSKNIPKPEVAALTAGSDTSAAGSAITTAYDKDRAVLPKNGTLVESKEAPKLGAGSAKA